MCPQPLRVQRARSAASGAVSTITAAMGARVCATIQCSGLSLGQVA